MSFRGFASTLTPPRGYIRQTAQLLFPGPCFALSRYACFSSANAAVGDIRTTSSVGFAMPWTSLRVSHS